MTTSRSRLVLATDLDGTMAHGDAGARSRLVALLRSRPEAVLIYVTGRSVEATAELAQRVELPEPEVLIADVGTSVLRGFGPARVTSIETELERGWPGVDAVRDRLGVLEKELTPQDVRAPRRVSYWVEPVRRMRTAASGDAPGDASGAASGDATDDASADAFAARPPGDPSLGTDAAELADAVARRAASALEGMEVDVLLSANVFLDVLPRGVDKGSTLRRVLAWLGAEEDDCVVAGDSLNDLALFQTGMRGIVVGNCEPALRERVAGMERVYQARGEGVAGVLEGLRHHGHPEGDDGHGE
ncbi:MAG: HAD family hydrolase [Gemmatimonadetes bacterium]|nr:HAD family hydrolase [Gemmatimonadota bacterium]